MPIRKERLLAENLTRHILSMVRKIPAQAQPPSPVENTYRHPFVTSSPLPSCTAPVHGRSHSQTDFRADSSCKRGLSADGRAG